MLNEKNININFPEIKTRIAEKHKLFLGKYKSEVDQVNAEQKYITEIIYARILRVLECFKETGIIDEINKDEINLPPNYVISKHGLSNSVIIIANSDMILLSCVNGHTDIRFNNPKYIDFDWSSFVDTLLDYIHAVIYQRAEAFGMKINNVMGL